MMYNFKSLYTQHRSTSKHKTNTNRHKRRHCSNTIRDFDTPLTPMDRSSKQKISKKTQVLNDTLDDMDLIIFRTFHPNAEEYTFFSSAYGTFSRTDHILGHRSNLSKFKKIEIISSIFSDHNAARLDINNRKKKKPIKNTKTWKLWFLLTNRSLNKSNRKSNYA